MYRFYVSKEQITDDKVYIDGTDVNHIKNVLRLEKGDWIIACDKEGTDYVSRISDISSERVVLNIEKVQDSDTELPCKIGLFQGLPKKDKMEFIIRGHIDPMPKDAAYWLKTDCGTSRMHIFSDEKHHKYLPNMDQGDTPVGDRTDATGHHR